MQDPIPQPVPHPRTEETVSRSRTRAPATARGAAHRPPVEQMAAALKAHRALSRGLKQNVPLTALGPDRGVRGLAAFAAVYAAHQEQDLSPNMPGSTSG